MSRFSAEARDPQVIDLERRLHHGPSGEFNPDNPLGLDGWSLNHEERYDYVTSVPYDPDQFPEQRIDVAKTPPARVLDFLPAWLLSRGLEAGYLKVFKDRARNALAAFDGTPANSERPIEAGGKSITRAIGDIVLRSESIAVLTSHAEGWEDVGIYHGAVARALAMRRGSLVKKAGSVLNELQTREAYHGKRIAEYFRFFGSIYWTVPDTVNTQKWQIEDDVIRKAVSGFGRQVKTDQKTGLALTLAPGAKAMEQVTDPESGELKALYQSNMSAATAKMISKFSHYIVTASWDKKVNVSNIIDNVKLEGHSQAEQRQIIADNANRIQEMLAQQTANLAQVPVIFEVFTGGKDEEHVEKLIAEPELLAA